MILVANKADLDTERLVTKQEGEDLAMQYKVYYYLDTKMKSVCAISHLSLSPLSPRPSRSVTLTQIKYVETSAKIQLNVEKAFHDLVRVIRQAQKPDSLKEKKKKKRRCTIL
jgi:GTPase SAR1 family protein